MEIICKVYLNNYLIIFINKKNWSERDPVQKLHKFKLKVTEW